MHSTDDLEDGYLGSGVRLTRSVKKYGKDQHVREIIEVLPTRQLASEREKELITEDLRADPLCLNCGAGGLGAVDRQATKEETRQKISGSLKKYYSSDVGRDVLKSRSSDHYVSGEKHGMYGRTHTDEVKTRIRINKVGKPMPPFTEEHRKHLSESATSARAKRRETQINNLQVLFPSWVENGVYTASGDLDTSRTLALTGIKVPRCVLAKFLEWLDETGISRRGGWPRKKAKE